jgi:hypothetical protein
VSKKLLKKIFGEVFSEVGGVKYHLRAALNRSRWQPFANFVGHWLDDWLRGPNMTGVSTLVLMGPSAGYTLPMRFVSHFSRVVVVEPDPLAYALFEARFNCKALWVRLDYFGLDEKPPNPEKLLNLVTAYPNSAILFCNVLGQLPVILRNKKNVDVEKYMSDLSEVLKKLSSVTRIASYHDRYSRSLRRPNEVTDHLTGELFKFLQNKKEFPWKISMREEHQIEFVRN